METAQPHTPAVNPAFGQAALHDLADRMIQLSGVQPHDRVTLIGRHRLEMLLDLYRRGFTEVGCDRGTITSPHDSADALWILRVETEPALDALLAGLGRALRPGGTVVVWCRHPAPNDIGGLRVQGIRRLFVERGLVPLIQSADGGSGYLLSAHKPAAATLRTRGAA